MKRLAVPIASIAISACTLAPPAGEHPHTRSDAIQGGQPETGSVFAVGIFDDQGTTCSGTLIAPNLVVTARHCVATDNGGDTVDCAHDAFKTAQAASTLAVSTDETSAYETAKIGVAKIVVPDDATFCGNDLALLILDKPITSALAAPGFDPKAFGTELSAIGYGTTSTTATDEGTRRRRDHVPIQCVPGATTPACDPADYSMVATELAAGDGLCDGDSGSGAYVQSSLVSPTPIVVGVLSRGGESGNKCTDAIYERLDGHQALLVATAKEAAAKGGYPLPAWAGGTATEPDAGADDAGADDDAGTGADDGSIKIADSGSSGGCSASPARNRAEASWIFAVLALFVFRRRNIKPPTT